MLAEYAPKKEINGIFVGVAQYFMAMQVNCPHIIKVEK